MPTYTNSLTEPYVLAHYALGEMLAHPKLQTLHYKAAAKLDFAPAQYKLGELYNVDGGAHQSEALQWYLRAVQHHFPRALERLGYLYAEGKLVPQNDKEAFYWWRRAAAYGRGQAAYEIARWYKTGRYVSQSDSKARQWLEKAASFAALIAYEDLDLIQVSSPVQDQCLFWTDRLAFSTQRQP